MVTLASASNIVFDQDALDEILRKENEKPNPGKLDSPKTEQIVDKIIPKPFHRINIINEEPPFIFPIINRSKWESMNIKSVLNKIDCLAELLIIVKNANVNLSFWGGRYITVLGFKGELGIDDLAGKVMDVIKKNPNFDENERKYGKFMRPLIDNIYEDYDKLFKKCRIVTKIFVVIRDIPSIISRCFSWRNCSRIRWKWLNIENRNNSVSFGDAYYHIFKYYTSEQYTKTFGEIPDKNKMLYGRFEHNKQYWAPKNWDTLNIYD